MRRTILALLAAPALLLAVATPGDAQPAGPPPLAVAMRTDAPLSRQARNFLRDAALDGIAALRMGRLALERAESPAVRDFAAATIARHAEAGRRLDAIARSAGIALPDRPDPVTDAEITDMAGLSGARFDRRYMGAQEEMHERAIKLYEAAAEEIDDGRVAGFARDALPVLAEQRDRVRRITAGLAGGMRHDPADGPRPSGMTQ